MTTTASPYSRALERAFAYSQEYLSELDSVPVGAMDAYATLRQHWNTQLQNESMVPEKVIDELVQSVAPGLHASQSGRFFSWVIGGTQPAALAADWLTSVWDQNSGMFSVAPSGALAEEVAGQWLKEVLRLPPGASFALVTGCQMAHFTCLAAARNELFHRLGWDIELRGFYGAPRIRIVCSDQKHATVNRALRMLGFGSAMMEEVPTDQQGCIQVDVLRHVLAEQPDTPTLLLLQAGDVNTGGFDDFKHIIPLARAYNCWVHIDGAFGLWAASSQSYRHLLDGAEMADSWATDGHKWLNVPYDCGYAIVAHPEPHARAMSQTASYLSFNQEARDQMAWNPEFSRRARGFATWAALRQLGRQGIEAMIDNSCAQARAIVDGIAVQPGVEVLTYPVINQGLVRFHAPSVSGGTMMDDHYTETIIRKVNESGEAFFQPTTYKGQRCMRISVSGWRTNATDVQRTIAAFEKVLQESQ